VNEISTLIAALLQIPAVKAFLEDMEKKLEERAEQIALRVATDILHRSDKDPEFREKWTVLASQLASQTTEEGRRNVLQQMQALRGR
jgi:hypothetical protein